MKPFTLQWWVLQKDTCYSRQIKLSIAAGCTEPDTIDRMLIVQDKVRYAELSRYITNRIIRDYSRGSGNLDQMPIIDFLTDYNVTGIHSDRIKNAIGGYKVSMPIREFLNFGKDIPGIGNDTYDRFCRAYYKGNYEKRV